MYEQRISKNLPTLLKYIESTITINSVITYSKRQHYNSKRKFEINVINSLYMSDKVLQAIFSESTTIIDEFFFNLIAPRG